MTLSVFAYGSSLLPAHTKLREFNWVVGVILLKLTLLLAFLIVAPWDQLALWAVTVGTNMMGFTPVFGDQVHFVLWEVSKLCRNTAPVVCASRLNAPLF